MKKESLPPAKRQSRATSYVMSSNFILRLNHTAYPNIICLSLFGMCNHSIVLKGNVWENGEDLCWVSCLMTGMQYVIGMWSLWTKLYSKKETRSASHLIDRSKKFEEEKDQWLRQYWMHKEIIHTDTPGRNFTQIWKETISIQPAIKKCSRMFYEYTLISPFEHQNLLGFNCTSYKLRVMTKRPFTVHQINIGRSFFCLDGLDMEILLQILGSIFCDQGQFW